MSDETNNEQASDGATASDSQVLSEAEVDALLDGVKTGVIEVQSAGGPRYANVRPFDIPRRSHIATHSLPRLDLMNEKLAERLRRRTQLAVGSEIGITSVETSRTLFGDFLESCASDLATIEFTAQPLPGAAALVFESALVSRLVEVFFGGSANGGDTPRHDGYTAGVLRVIDAYTKIVLDALAETWSSVQSITPVVKAVETSASLLGIAEDADALVRSDFEYEFASGKATMTLLMPQSMIEAHLPALEGSHKATNPTEIDRWSTALRDGLPGVSVDLKTTVGKATMTLAELICLEPGDVIPIENPTDAIILANDVRLLTGRFGVHGGVNAVAAKRWIAGAANEHQKDESHG